MGMEHSAKTEIIFNNLAPSRVVGSASESILVKKGTDCVDLLHLLCHRLSAFGSEAS